MAYRLFIPILKGTSDSVTMGRRGAGEEQAHPMNR